MSDLLSLIYFNSYTIFHWYIYFSPVKIQSLSVIFKAEYAIIIHNIFLIPYCWFCVVNSNSVNSIIIIIIINRKWLRIDKNLYWRTYSVTTTKSFIVGYAFKISLKVLPNITIRRMPTISNNIAFKSSNDFCDTGLAPLEHRLVKFPKTLTKTWK